MARPNQHLLLCRRLRGRRRQLYRIRTLYLCKQHELFFLQRWIDFNPNIDKYVHHYKDVDTITCPFSNFNVWYPNTLMDMWLLIYAGIKVNPCYQKGLLRATQISMTLWPTLVSPVPLANEILQFFITLWIKYQVKRLCTPLHCESLFAPNIYTGEKKLGYLSIAIVHNME